MEKEHSFPAPSEKEKLERAIKRYSLVLSRYPQRLDIGEIKFGLADMYIGRGGDGEHRAQSELGREDSGADDSRARVHRGPRDIRAAHCVFSAGQNLGGKIGKAENKRGGEFCLPAPFLISRQVDFVKLDLGVTQ